MTAQQARPDDPIERAIRQFVADGYGPGSVISTEWFRAQFDLQEPHTAAEADRFRILYAQYMGRLRMRLLVERKIALRTKPGVGQEIVKPQEQTAWAMDDARTAIKVELDRARDRVEHIDLSALSAVEQAENRDAIAKLSFFRTQTVRKLEG